MPESWASNALPAGVSCLRQYSGRKSAALRHADVSPKGPLAGEGRKLPAREGQQLAWVRASKLRDYKMPPADIPLIPHLLDLLL